MPNSINGQQTSVIVIRDKEKKAKLAELVGNQEYVTKALFLVFVMDFYRTYLTGERTGYKQVIHKDIEGILAGSVDCGIILGASVIAAESLGLGTFPIGGIRKNPEEVIELLGLPKYTFPMVGLAIGYPADESHKKPRIPFSSYKHKESYNKSIVEASINTYDEEMSKYLKDIGDLNKKQIGVLLQQESIKQFIILMLKKRLISKGLNQNNILSKINR
ncbi:FMN reductase [NAD(P)H] [Clostridium beijerinckii]|nr:FMN reductase [NAD(P)H] [Clostridium beijerinckii]